LYRRERGWKDWETIALQGILVSSNHKEVHDSRYAICKAPLLTIGGDFTAGNGTGMTESVIAIIDQAENQFMVRNSKMRIFYSSMKRHFF
jgi:hypothetical protein